MWGIVGLKALRGGSDFPEMLDRIHGDYVHGRRVRVLARLIADLLPEAASVLDIGCGDGMISGLVQRQRPDVRVQGADVLVRPDAHIDVLEFDGETVPAPDGSFDVVILLDVLHHTDDPRALLAEATRLTRGHVIIKDHDGSGFLATPTLRLMDWVGNSRHGVHLPYNYWPGNRWQAAFQELGLVPESHRTELGLYAGPLNWLFGRRLHFLTVLQKDAASVWAADRAA